MKKPIPLHTPPAFQRYDCHMCGACCRAGFAVVVTEEERDRISRQGWSKHPEFQGRELFVRHPDGQYVVAQRRDGACIFLDQDNACRIHARFGEKAKPFSCRPYPFVLLASGSRMRVSLRFDCPSVAGNRGRPLPEHRSSLQSLLVEALPGGVPAFDPPAFRPDFAFDWQELSLATLAFDALLAAESLDITRRILACTDLAELLARARIADLRGPKLEEFLGVLTRGLIKGVEVNPLERRRPSGMVPLLFRQAAGLYGRLDRVSDVRASTFEKSGQIGRRFLHSLRILIGTGTVPAVREGLPRVVFAALERPSGIPSAEASETLTRYYRVRLDAMGFCGRAMYGWPFLEGMGALLLTYPLTLWFARLFALGAGKPAIDAEAMQQAIRVVDRPHGNSVALSLRPERARLRFLSQHRNLVSLIIWYGT